LNLETKKPKTNISPKKDKKEPTEKLGKQLESEKKEESSESEMENQKEEKGNPGLLKFVEYVESILAKPESEIVEISLPLLKDSECQGFLNELSDLLAFETIGNKLFIKVDSGRKELLHKVLVNSLENQLGTWTVMSKAICMVNGNKYLPDVGAWAVCPSSKQLDFPEKEKCPGPDVWIEVVYNRKDDREYALQNIQQLLATMPNTEFVLIAIPKRGKSVPANPNPTATQSAATVLTAQPGTAPFLGYWPRNSTFNNSEWYNIDWNEYLVLRDCGARISFNIIMQKFTL